MPIGAEPSAIDPPSRVAVTDGVLRVPRAPSVVHQQRELPAADLGLLDCAMIAS